MKFSHIIKSLFFSNSPHKKLPVYIFLMTKNKTKSRFIRKILQRKIYYTFHSDISYTAQIDESTNFVHPLGIVIGSKAIIEQNCFIYQNVTIGSNTNNSNMPKIQQNCKIFAGATIFGDIIIGENSVIGTNAVVNISIPANSTVVGYNKIISKSLSKHNN